MLFKRLETIALSVLVSSVFLPLSSCKKSSPPIKAEAENVPKAVKLPAILQTKTGSAYKGWTPFTVSDFDTHFKDYDPILHGVSRKQFKVLDAYVERFDERYPDGTTTREKFYSIFGSYSDINTVNPEKYFDTYITNLKLWREQTKHKAQADIALANFYKNIAWHHRGGGYVDTVSEPQWEKFHHYIDLAKKTCEQSDADVKSDPAYYQVALKVAMAQSHDLKSCLALFEEGQKVDPTYMPTYSAMTYLLQPKWSGKTPSDWHSFLVYTLPKSKLTEKEQSVIYGQQVRENIRGEYNAHAAAGGVYQVFEIDKQRFMQGLKDFADTVPHSSDWPTHYIYHAWKARDESALKSAFAYANKRYNPDRWGGKKGEEWFELLEEIQKEFPHLTP